MLGQFCNPVVFMCFLKIWICKIAIPLWRHACNLKNQIVWHFGPICCVFWPVFGCCSPKAGRNTQHQYFEGRTETVSAWLREKSHQMFNSVLSSIIKTELPHCLLAYLKSTCILLTIHIICVYGEEDSTLESILNFGSSSKLSLFLKTLVLSGL